MKKRTPAFALALLLSLSLAACGDDDQSSTQQTASMPETSQTEQPSPASSSHDIDHPLLAQAQILANSNGDSYTPFNLQWVDGENGIISFEVQRPDITSPPDYHEYKILVFQNGKDIISTGIGGFVAGRTPEPTTTVTVDLNEGAPYSDFGAGEYVFIAYAALNDEVFGQVVKSDTIDLSGPPSPDHSSSSDPVAQTNPNNSDTPHQDAITPGQYTKDTYNLEWEPIGSDTLRVVVSDYNLAPAFNVEEGTRYWMMIYFGDEAGDNGGIWNFVFLDFNDMSDLSSPKVVPPSIGWAIENFAIDFNAQTITFDIKMDGGAEKIVKGAINAGGLGGEVRVWYSK